MGEVASAARSTWAAGSLPGRTGPSRQHRGLARFEPLAVRVRVWATGSAVAVPAQAEATRTRVSACLAGSHSEQARRQP